MGTEGYLLSIILADAVSAIFLFTKVRLRRYLKLRSFSYSFFKQMLRYSLPLVPASMLWWITQASDRYFVIFMSGQIESGLYGVAYKIPTIITIFSTVFLEAWQLSAVTDGQKDGRERFFSQTFLALLEFLCIASGLLIMLTQPIMRILASENFFTAWHYVPILVLSTTFSSFVAFQNSIYMVNKRSILSLLTMLTGAICNLILNAILIPYWGPNGATVSTLISYLLIFIIRGINTQRLIRINYQPFKIIINTLLLIAEIIIILQTIYLWQLWSALIVILLVVINHSVLFRIVKMIRGHRQRKKDK